MRFSLDLFKKITSVEFSTDYSTGGFLYPPLFVWPKIKNPGAITGEIRKIAGHSDVGLGLYVHFPFCRSKCAFCRFFSLENKNPDDYERFLTYLIKELKLWAKLLKSAKGFKKIPLESVYLGGGTPTLFNLEKFFDALRKDFEIKNCRQINLESTLDALDEKKLRFYKKIGVNRLLIGIQSLDTEVLKKTNRFPAQARILEKVYFSARKIGLPAITFELIGGLPGQSRKSFFSDLKRLIALKPDGMHIYAFLKTPLSAVGKENPTGKGSCRLFSCRGGEWIRHGYQLLKESGYVNMGDEWIYGQSRNARNFQNSSRAQSVIPIGPSALGNFKKNDLNLRLFNVLDLAEYARSVKNGRLPLAKYFRLEGDELTRSWMVTLMARSAIEKRLIPVGFQKEIAWLKSRGAFEEKGNLFYFGFRKNNIGKIVYPKIFYSRKIIEMCKKRFNEPCAD